MHQFSSRSGVSFRCRVIYTEAFCTAYICRVPPPRNQISKLRNWQSGLQATVKVGTIVVRLIGASMMWCWNPTRPTPYDTKTKGWKTTDDGSQFYPGQMDLYAMSPSQTAR